VLLKLKKDRYEVVALARPRGGEGCFVVARHNSRYAAISLESGAVYPAEADPRGFALRAAGLRIPLVVA